MGSREFEKNCYTIGNEIILCPAARMVCIAHPRGLRKSALLLNRINTLLNDKSSRIFTVFFSACFITNFLSISVHSVTIIRTIVQWRP